MKNKQFKKYFYLNLLVVSLFFLLSFSSQVKANQPFDPSGTMIPLPSRPMDVPILAPAPTVAVVADTVAEKTNLLQRIWETIKDNWQNMASKALNKSVRNTLNRLAYDAADDLMSGGDGQQPKILTKNWGEYFVDIGDSAIGDFIDDLNEWNNIDLCQPNVDVKLAIGLGLQRQVRPGEPNCKATTMAAAWTNEYQRLSDMQSEDFLKKFMGFFKPEANSLGVSLSLMQGAQYKKEKAIEDTKDYTIATKGEKEKAVSDAGDKKEDTPGASLKRKEEAEKQLKENVGKYTGNPLVDAANVFLSHLAIKAFQEATKAAFSGSGSSGGGAGDLNKERDIAWLTNPETDVSSNKSKVQAELKQILEPRFDTRGDFDILASLSTCPEMGGLSGPVSADSCVIDENFRQAIADQKTVGEAMDEGYLHKDWVFAGQNINNKINYNEGYSARSLAILRKYRIIPLGWEEALNRAANRGISATLKDLVSCFSPDDEYTEFSNNFRLHETGWCQGLVDPKWVLKAPKNYCAKLGNGHVLSSDIIGAFDTGEPDGRTKSQTYVMRATDYCADSKSCIKEKSDGTCEAFGYCSEEKRTWNFGSDDCEPVYNTCETFRKVDGGQTTSYLKNTLDYADCDADSVGCKSYADSGIYFPENNILKWQPSSLLFLNSSTENCTAEEEACDEVVRVKNNYGHNFITNGNFEKIEEKYQWTCDPNVNYEDCLLPGYRSSKAVKLNDSFIQDFQNKLEVEVGPSDYNISGNTYTFSFYAKDCENSTTFGFIEADGTTIAKSSKLTDSTSWEYYRLSYTYPGGLYIGNTVPVFIELDDFANEECTIDQVKLELGNKGTLYTEYASSNLSYQKMIPDYLWEDCYVNPYSGNTNFSLKENAPNMCDKFSRRCNEDEVGCDLYTSVDNPDTKIAAKTTTLDYCREECNHYNLYVQQDNYFFSKKTETFIPETAKSCSASAEGCSEFTNLDKLAEGGESKDYYKTIRQCIKPETNDCANFYTWEGSDESGYQLKSYTLKKDGDEPFVTEVDSALCNEDIFNLPPFHPDYNSDCYEFYNTDGETSYHLYSRTVTCSDNCHPYRLSDKNIDYEKNDLASCSSSSSMYWDEDQGICYSCKNNGTWSEDHNACIYQIIPDLGEKCSASENKCRKYNGNSGSNIRIVSSYDFNYSKEGWYAPNCADATSLSSESLNRGGKSLKFNNYVFDCNNPASTSRRNPIIKTALADNPDEPQIETVIGRRVKEGSSYVIKFLAKSTININLSVFFENETGDTEKFNRLDTGDESISIYGDNNWHSYELNLNSLDHKVGLNELLVIKDVNSTPDYDSFYIDDIVLTEVIDKYYLISDSWKTPPTCYYDVLNDYRGSSYNLGCSAYIDNSGSVNYLRQFSKLCQDSAVGCELMIDTKNSSDYLSSDYGDVEVEADEYMYAVYNQNKVCLKDDKGCQRLGASYKMGDGLTFKDVYLKNDPDKYDRILCDSSTVDCESYVNDSGNTVFFKDPGNQVCEWRPDSTGQNWAWFKKSSKRCDSNNNREADNFENTCINSSDCYINSATVGECNSDEDCRLNICNNNTCSLSGEACGSAKPCSNTNICVSGHCTNSCIGATGDFECDTETTKTFGFGGRGNLVYQPTDWAGLCVGSASTCTEYIDPLSSYVVNELLNPSFSDKNGDSTFGDDWKYSSTTSTYKQTVKLIPNKVYTFGFEASPEAITNINISQADSVYIKCDGNVLSAINSDNQLTALINEISFTGEQYNNHLNFLFTYLPTATKCEVHRTAGTNSLPQEGITVILKESVIDYRLAKDLDRNSCSGTDLEDGCILFNERATSGDNLKSLIFTAYDSYNSSSQSPTEKSGDNQDVDIVNANSLIKVRPDRVCASWLACASWSYDKNGDKVCHDVIDCDTLDANGDCSNRIKAPEGVRTFETSRDKNASGYSLLNAFFISNMRELGVNISEAHYDFESGEQANLEKIESSAIRIVDEPMPAEKILVDYPAHGKGFLEINGHWGAQTSSSTPFSVQRNKKYIINYLVNSSALTVGDKVVMSILGIDDSGNTQTIFQKEHNTRGWEKHVYEFTPVAVDKIIIKFSSKKENVNSVYYVDNINIETSLAYSEDNNEDLSYIAKECRLYPRQESLSCQSTSESVISNGWEGYCLQRDPYNPDICLMWYPVDVISSQSGSTATKNSGYSGKIPLWYCSEANGNFDLAEKRMPYYLLESDSKFNKSFCFKNEDFGQHAYGCDSSGCRFGDSGQNGCDSNNFPSTRRGRFYYFKNENQKNIYRNLYGFVLEGHPEEKRVFINSSEVDDRCGDNDDYAFVADVRGECKGGGNTKNKVYMAAACIPVGNDFLERKNLSGSLYSDSDTPAIIDADGNLTCNSNKNVLKTDGVGWYKYNNNLIGEENNRRDGDSDPKLKVYDYDQGNLYDLDKYNVQCNELVQVVEASGNNKAWSGRSNDSSPTSTPDFFLGYTGLDGYEYAAYDPPYGSASLKSGWMEDVVNFNNIDNSDMLGNSSAGLPYGCEGGTGDSCNLLGYCSGNPSVLCIYSNSVMDEKTCPDFGSCKKLNFDSSYEAKNILQNLFLKTYSVKEFSNGVWGSGGSGFDFSADNSNSNTRIEVCPPDIDGKPQRDPSSRWCFIPPSIEKISLEFKGSPLNLTPGQGYEVLQSGEYELKFNTIIDSEQAPLGDIIIDWGDDSGLQTISNQDYHPDENYPHIITHSYIYPEVDPKNIKIQVVDNWGFNRCCAPAESPACSFLDYDNPTPPPVQCPSEQ